MEKISQMFMGNFMKFHGTDVDEISWNSMENSWNFMEFRGISWNFMEFRGISWNSVEFMEFHEIRFRQGVFEDRSIITQA
jgi:hypothetical protein